MKKYLLSILCLFLVACTANLPIETNMKEKVAAFTFTDQDGRQVSREDLLGSWWIADFIFTNCTTACLPMTSNMARLQGLLAEHSLDVQLISFTVDPDTDSPEILKDYGEDYGADFDQWTFLTGYDFDTIKQLSVKSFRAFLQSPEAGSDQFTHDTRFFLVDPEGNIVKGYSGLESKNVDSILDDLLSLQAHDLIN